MPIAEELRARTFRFALRIIAFCRSLPPSWEAREIARQLFRAGTSVASNYRAACRGRSRREFVAKLGIVVEEADESVFWLSVLAQSGIAQGSELQDLLTEAQELLAIFSKSRRTARENHQFTKSPIRQLTKSPTDQFTKSPTRQFTKSIEGPP